MGKKEQKIPIERIKEFAELFQTSKEYIDKELSELDKIKIQRLELQKYINETTKGGMNMYHEVGGIEIYERKCFLIFIRDILKLMKNYKKYDGNLDINTDDNSHIYIFDKDNNDFLYDEVDIIECVSESLGVKINNMFLDGDVYSGVLYFTERKLEE